MNKNKAPHTEAQKVARELAALLGEKHHGVIGQIRRVVQLCGADFARELYAATQEIEANGGMMLPDQSRRRTPGGVFMNLVRTKLNNEQRNQIFYGNVKMGMPLLSWTERISLVQALQTAQGTVKSVKVTLRGRPERIEKQAEVVVITLIDENLINNLPRELPKLPPTPTVAIVYVTGEQWETVEATRANPSDILIVEGVCVFDPEIKSVVVYAASIQNDQPAAKKLKQPK